MRKISSLCKRLTRQTGCKWGVVKFSGAYHGKKFHAYKVYVFNWDHWEMVSFCYTIAETERFLLDQFV